MMDRPINLRYFCADRARRVRYTLAATNKSGEAVGVAALREADDELNTVDRGGRLPRLRALVRQDRHRGYGRLLVTGVEDLAA